jgi:POT family proton-dependent oligopeptide transporter
MFSNLPLSINIMLIAWAYVAVIVTIVIYFQRKEHPKALFVLFFTELWERFSYYGMRALLILYMTKALFYNDAMSYGIYGAYVSLVYATPVIGGIIADRLIGSRNAIMLGAILMAIGHFAMTFEHEAIFFVALGFLIIGNGCFKPNISTLVGKLYSEGDSRRDGAFTLFYMGINIGAFLTPLTCGAIGEEFGWHYGFGIAGVGMVIGLLIFSYGNWKKLYEDKGLPPNPEFINQKIFAGLSLKVLIYIGAFLSVPLLALLVNQNEISSKILLVVGSSVVIYLLYLSFKEDKIQKERLWVILVLFLFTIMFWTFFELAGSAITLFTERNVDRTLSVFKDGIPTSLFQSVNPFFIIHLAPLFALLWVWLGKKDKDPSAPFKFGISLMQLGLGFAILVVGAKFAGSNGLVPMVFLIFAYLLHTTGELCISPIGLSLVTKMAPGRIMAFVMGVWLLSSSFAGLIGSEISKLTSLPSEEGIQPLAAESLLVYTGVFEWIAYISIGTGFVLLFLVPILKKWMHGVK